MTIWTYNDQPFTSGDIGKHIGFVYLLTDRQNGKRYIGKRLFNSTKTLPPLKGKSRKRTKVTESDWKDYCSSNRVIQQLVETHGIDRFKREILHLCRTKSEMTYHETRLQFQHDVLMSDDWYNDYIQARISGKHLTSLRRGIGHD